MRALLRNALLLATMSPWLSPVAAAASVGGAAAATGWEPEPGAGNPAPNPRVQELGALVDRLVGEVRELKLDLLQQQIEMQAEKIARLERELEQVQTERASLEKQEGSMREDTSSQEDLLAEGALTEDQRAEMQAVGAELEAAERRGSRDQWRSIEERERALTPQLEQERARLQELLARKGTFSKP